MRKAWGALFSLLVAGVVVSACDPDLHIVRRPGTDGGSATGHGDKDERPSPTVDASASSDLDAGGDAAGRVPDEEPLNPSTGHKIDGIDDFASNEKVPTTSSGYYGYIAWDASRLYFGMSGSDVASRASNKWVHVYLGVPGTPGTNKGIPYGPQQPTLPFEATHHLRWKASGDFTSVEVFDAGSWRSANAALVPIIAAQQGELMEMSVTRASINATGKIAVHMNMLIEGGGDWTFAGVPSTSFIDGKDPKFGKYFELDLTDTTKPPNAYVAE
jgi:hypothetical protein